MPQKPEVTILHEIPGRVRFGLSLPAKDVLRLEESISGHEGIESVSYTRVTSTVLVRFDPDLVKTEEIAIRLALSLSRDYGAVPVRLLSQPDVSEISQFGLYSGILLTAAFGVRLLNGQASRAVLWERAAGVGTALAVVEHGWSDIRRRGNLHPEVLSVVYLLVALLRGNSLAAAFFTWMTAFGRHLVGPQPSGVELRPIEMAGEESEAPEYEIAISPGHTTADRTKLLTLLPTVVMNALSGAPQFGRGNLFEDIRNVSNLHGEVLEGLGEFRHGIPVRFR